MRNNRTQLIDNFLLSCGLVHPNIEPLAQDASFRQYFRIQLAEKTYILMDAPTEHEEIKPFIKVAKHLLNLNLHAPLIHNFDVNRGFILLEDFGDKTFTQLLKQGDDETTLYQIATDCLIKLHQHKQAKSIELSHYSNELLVNEALLLCDWYYPKVKGYQIAPVDRDNYIKLWRGIFDSLPPIDDTLVLRDFHVDNLIKLESGACGLLDFQDAVIGSPAYDLVSLLEDARRDISTQLRNKMLCRYFSAIDINRENFMQWYAVLGAQRHCKVIGIFTRLSARDGKDHYLRHLPRVKNLLQAHLEKPFMKPLDNWLNHMEFITNF